MAKEKIPMKEKAAAAKQKLFKILIDSRTKITVKSEEAVQMWLDRYPNAKVEA